MIDYEGAEEISPALFIAIENKNTPIIKYILETYSDEIHEDMLYILKGLVDCIILLRMFGKNRVVTEVLDTRDRSVSFDNIFRTSGRD